MGGDGRGACDEGAGACGAAGARLRRALSPPPSPPPPPPRARCAPSRAKSALRARPPGTSGSKPASLRRHRHTSRSSGSSSPWHGASPDATDRASAVYSCGRAGRRGEAGGVRGLSQARKDGPREENPGGEGKAPMAWQAGGHARHHDSLRDRRGVGWRACQRARGRRGRERGGSAGRACWPRAFVPRAACHGGSSSGTGAGGARAPRLRGAAVSK